MAKRAKKKTGTRRKTGYTIALLIMGIVAIGFLVMLILLNALPTGLTMGLITVLLGLLLICAALFTSKKKGVRITGIILAIFFMIVFSSATVFMGSTYAMLNNISGSGQGIQTGSSSKINVTEEPFNVYITGIDQWSKEKGLDLERSDVNMIVTVNPQTRKVLLTSIPRDAYVKLHTAGQMDKLTHTGVYGVDETINTVEDWLGLDLKYYIKVNFTAVVKMINAMGGITVESPVAFKSSISKFQYGKGKNPLSGKAALYFARERKAFEGKDSNRVENQQIVIKAMIDKMTSSSTLLTHYGDLLEAAAGDMETDMPVSDMQALVKMQLGDMRTWDIQSQKVSGEYDMDYVASLTQDQKFQVYKTDDASVASCIDNINAVMNPTAEELAAVEDARKEASFRNFLKGLRGGSAGEEGSEG